MTGVQTCALPISVQTINKDLVAASEENAVKMNAVQAALVSAGISKDDIATENYNINQESHWENSRQILGNYRVSNEITATVRKIDQAGVIIDSAVKAGANRLSSITFGITDTMQMIKQARIQAVKQAEESANLLASTSSATLGKVLTITEEQTPYEAAFKAGNTLMSAASDAAPTSISAEKTKISITVDVTYALQ